MTTIRIDVSVGDDELKQYGKVFNARDPAEAKQFPVSYTHLTLPTNREV